MMTSTATWKQWAGIAIGIVVFALLGVWYISEQRQSSTEQTPTPSPTDISQQPNTLDPNQPLSFEDMVRLGIVNEDTPREHVREGLTLQELIALGVIKSEEDRTSTGLTREVLFQVGVLKVLENDRPGVAGTSKPAPITAPSGSNELLLATLLATSFAGAISLRRLVN